MSNRIYLSPPHIGTDELKLVEEAFLANWIAPAGPHLDAFEREFENEIGGGYAVAVASGTAALHLALLLNDIGPGDEVWCSTLTFVGSVNPILYVGATPVFIDSDFSSWNLDPQLLSDALAQRAQKKKLPKALIVVHLYGQCADMDPIKSLCEHYGVILIEDAAEALGANYKGRSPGLDGRQSLFSFNGNKIITSSGGGMLVCQQKKDAERARYLATQAREPALHYEHTTVGYNYRLSNVSAAIGRGQLRVLKSRVEDRRRNFDLYSQALGSLPGVSFMPEPDFSYHTRWLTTVLIDSKEASCSSADLVSDMSAVNIECRPVWKPMHMQPLFKDAEVIGGEVAEQLFRTGICLPSGSSLSDSERARVIDVFCDRFSRR